VRTDPEPDNEVIFFTPAERAITIPDSHRIDVILWDNRLEMQTGVIGVLLEQAISGGSLFSYILRQRSQ
jgi:hypothetical protein